IGNGGVSSHDGALASGQIGGGPDHVGSTNPSQDGSRISGKSTVILERGRTAEVLGVRGIDGTDIHLCRGGAIGYRKQAPTGSIATRVSSEGIPDPAEAQP